MREDTDDVSATSFSNEEANDANNEDDNEVFHVLKSDPPVLEPRAHKRHFVFVCVASVVTGTVGVVCLELSFHMELREVPKKKLLLSCLAVSGFFACACLCSWVPKGCRRKYTLPLWWAWILPKRCYRGRVQGNRMYCEQPCDGECICGPCLHLHDTLCYGQSEEQRERNLKRRALAAGLGASIFTALAVSAAYMGSKEWPNAKGEWPKGHFLALVVLAVSICGSLVVYDRCAGHRHMLRFRGNLARSDSVEMTGLRRERAVPLPRTSSWNRKPGIKPQYITAIPGWKQPWDTENSTAV
eukprot:gnl/MRDRNA2_/MRDRNA2_116107_c0_seq1.p1 gnl/MRDRNA2_/MRDRNA2_116107_c0~~gnl/MRDRNA2_/MRDRNA2_116107_c0_seq1.p1  ORF type:complete len:299 (+),score=38.40 gnl/MRDRNA2_/MRDRNA2_116107_c0_seq1:122-1018(+)